jgi:hypothetical protein
MVDDVSHVVYRRGAHRATLDLVVGAFDHPHAALGSGILLILTSVPSVQGALASLASVRRPRLRQQAERGDVPGTDDQEVTSIKCRDDFEA